MSNENIKSWPVQLYCRSELGTDYWTAHLTQCNDEIEYTRSDLVEQMQIEAIRATLLHVSQVMHQPDYHMTPSEIRYLNAETILKQLQD